jgi:hypothetical protein
VRRCPVCPTVRWCRCSLATAARLLAVYESGEGYRWDIRPQSLARQACRVAERRLTRAEWAEFLPGRDYDPAC